MGEDQNLEEFLLNTKPARLLVRLRQQTADNYATPLASDINATYSHTVKVLQKMKEFGLVRFSKKGRKKEILLTEDGEELAETLHELLNKLRRQG